MATENVETYTPRGLIGSLRAPRVRTRSRTASVGLSAVAVTVLVGALALLLSFPFATQLQADSYKALYDGRWIVQHGIPHTEALTVMAHGSRWIDMQWLAEVLFYQAWRIGGYGLFAGLALGMVALGCMILAAVMARRGASVWVVLGCGVLAILSLSGWQFIRSQDLVLPLFAALLAICLADDDHKRPGYRLLLLLPLLVLWANLHGSVLLGAALASAYLVVRAIRSERSGRRGDAVACGGLAIAAALTPFATPYGTAIIHYYREFLGNGPMAQLATEWSPPRFPTFTFYELAVPAVVVAVAVAFAFAKHRRPSALLLAAAGITFLAGAMRAGSVVWFGMVAALLLADTLKAWSPAQPRARRFVLLVGASGLLLGGAVVAQLARRSDSSYESLVSSRVIATTAAYARAHPCALILGDNLSSSALLWRDPWLAGRLGFDARIEQYSPRALSRWLVFDNAAPATWAAATRGYGVLIGDSIYARALARRLDAFPASLILARQGWGVAVVNNAGAGTTAPCGGVSGART
jgi:hypothetical protein